MDGRRRPGRPAPWTARRADGGILEGLGATRGSDRGRAPWRARAGPGCRTPCGEDVCITCSDTAVPSRVVELRDPGLALVDTGSTMEVISVALVDAGPGDTVLVHAGEAIGVIARV